MGIVRIDRVVLRMITDGSARVVCLKAGSRRAGIPIVPTGSFRLHIGNLTTSFGFYFSRSIDGELLSTVLFFQLITPVKHGYYNLAVLWEQYARHDTSEVLLSLGL